MKRCMKALIWIVVILLVGCVKHDVPQPEQLIITEPVVTKKEPTPFEQKNILTFSIVPITSKVDSRALLYEMHIFNHSNEKIKMEYVQFISNGNVHGLSVNNTMVAKSEITVLYQSELELTDFTGLHYTYYPAGEELQGIMVDLTKQTVEYYQSYASESNTYLPLIPNAGITIFSWKEKSDWKFDYLLGVENDKISVYNFQDSLINSFRWNISDPNIYYYIRALNGQIDDSMKAYIKEQMGFLSKYQDVVYVMQGKEDQFETLNQRYPFMRTIFVYEKGTNECKRTYCASIGYESSNLYSFSEDQLQSVGKNTYSLKELITELETYKYLNHFYVRGRDTQLTEKEAIELNSLFEKHDRRATVEGMKYVGADKPVIYLYPENEMNVSVEVDYHGKLRTTYPEYNNGWKVIAKPDGSLINLADGKEYSYLFWEGIGPVSYPMDEGFVVKKEETISFLQDKLSYLGLIPREYNEFIVYWLPYLQQNEYNLIVFQKEAYTNVAKLNINPAPDSILRVFMTFKGIDKPMNVKPQKLTPFTRKGFTVIEWGGVELSD